MSWLFMNHGGDVLNLGKMTFLNTVEHWDQPVPKLFSAADKTGSLNGYYNDTIERIYGRETQEMPYFGHLVKM